jgi:membrane protein
MTSPWRAVPGRALRRFDAYGCVDYAGSLAYRSLLALFPGLIALVSVLSLFGQNERTVLRLLDEARAVTPEQTWDSVRPVLESVLNAPAAGLGLAVGIVTTLWTASGYVKTFGRAMNTIYEVPEGRGVIRWNLQMYLLTAFLLVLAALGVMGLVISGPVADWVGAAVGLRSTVLTVWAVVRWGLVVLAVVVAVVLLYRGTPNIRLRPRTWFSPGAVLAIVGAAGASFLLYVYVARFGRFHATYGALAGIIVLMLWAFLVNAVLLFGAVLDSEIERVRQLRDGLPAEESLQVTARYTVASEKRDEQLHRDIEQAREVRAPACDGQVPGEKNVPSESE